MNKVVVCVAVMLSMGFSEIALAGNLGLGKGDIMPGTIATTVQPDHVVQVNLKGHQSCVAHGKVSGLFMGRDDVHISAVSCLENGSIVTRQVDGYLVGSSGIEGVRPTKNAGHIPTTIVFY